MANFNKPARRIPDGYHQEFYQFLSIHLNGDDFNNLHNLLGLSKNALTRVFKNPRRITKTPLRHLAYYAKVPVQRLIVSFDAGIDLISVSDLVEMTDLDLKKVFASYVEPQQQLPARYKEA